MNELVYATLGDGTIVIQIYFNDRLVSVTEYIPATTKAINHG